jgi:hypothetical protein
MILTNVNLLAVLVAAIASTAIGAFWYSPIGFGKQWMKLSKINMKDMKSMSLSPVMATFLGFLTALLIAFVLANFITYLGAFRIIKGLEIGFWFWLGFITTTQIGIVLWEGKSFKLYLINTAYSLITILIMSAIISVWY